MSSPLYTAGDSGWFYFFTQDSETFAQTEFKNLELRLPRGEDRVEQYYENLAALRQLLHDEYGSPDSDGQMFEIVSVPDDCAETRGAPGEAAERAARG